MDVGPRKRWALLALLIAIILIVCGTVGFRIAVTALKARVLQALPPGSEIKNIRVGWSSVSMGGLRIGGPSGWPSPDALRAERVTIVPSLRSILSRQYRIRNVTFLRPYVSAYRAKDGRFHVVPGLLAGTSGQGQTGALSASQAAFRRVTVGRVTVQDGTVEIFDAKVADPPLKIQLLETKLTMRNVVVPAQKGRSRFELTGVVKGVQRDGQVDIRGWVEVNTKDSSVKTQLRSMDMLVLQPYLLKAGEKGIENGTIDLNLEADVRNSQLRAPGTITISDLVLAPSEGALDTFMGLPRRSVITFLTDNNHRITVDFVLEGNVNNPRFSLTEDFAMRIALGMARTLGVNLVGMAKDVATLGLKGEETTGHVAKGTEGWLRRLLGGKKR